MRILTTLGVAGLLTSLSMLRRCWISSSNASGVVDRLVMNALRLDGFWSITEAQAALAHKIRGFLELLDWSKPAQELSST